MSPLPTPSPLTPRVSEATYVPPVPRTGPLLRAPFTMTGPFLSSGSREHVPTCARNDETHHTVLVDSSLGGYCLCSVNSKTFFFFYYLWTEGNTPFYCLRKFFLPLLNHPSPVTQSLLRRGPQISRQKEKGLPMKRSPGWAAMWFYHINSFLFLNRAFSCMYFETPGNKKWAGGLFKGIAGSQSNLKPLAIWGAV